MALDSQLPLTAHLLEVDPELGRGMSPEDLRGAGRFAVAPALRLEPGPWAIDQLDDVPQVTGRVAGFQVVSGLLGADVQLGDRICTRLVCPQDLILLDGLEGASLPADIAWSALESSTVAVLDDRLLTCCQRWPSLMSGVFRRAAEQSHHLSVQQAISQLPRVEDRLLALLWTLADRRGIARPEGMFVDVPVSHTTLAHMIGAQRPTVSLGLKELAAQGHIELVDGGWILDRASLDTFAADTSA